MLLWGCRGPVLEAIHRWSSRALLSVALKFQGGERQSRLTGGQQGLEREDRNLGTTRSLYHTPHSLLLGSDPPMDSTDFPHTPQVRIVRGKIPPQMGGLGFLQLYLTGRWNAGFPVWSSQVYPAGLDGPMVAHLPSLRLSPTGERGECTLSASDADDSTVSECLEGETPAWSLEALSHPKRTHDSCHQCMI